MPFYSAFTDKIGFVFRITLVKQIRTWYLILLQWYYKILRHIFQWTLESTTCQDWTASKFASHSRKSVKWRRGLPFYSGTSCLKTIINPRRNAIVRGKKIMKDSFWRFLWTRTFVKFITISNEYFLNGVQAWQAYTSLARFSFFYILALKSISLIDRPLL